MVQVAPRTDHDPDLKTQEIFSSIRKRIGRVPNMMSTMAVSTPVLEAYLAFSDSLSRGSLDLRTRESIALMISEVNGCQYCLAAHSVIAKAAKLPEAEVLASRSGHSDDLKIDAALRFARKLLAQAGVLEAQDWSEARQAGWTDQALVEIIANVALSSFTNTFNNATGVDIDFPAAPPLLVPGILKSVETAKVGLRHG